MCSLSSVQGFKWVEDSNGAGTHMGQKNEISQGVKRFTSIKVTIEKTYKKCKTLGYQFFRIYLYIRSLILTNNVSECMISY